MNIYDDDKFFDLYSKMLRSQQGLSGAGEWNQFRALFPDLSDKNVLDLGCGYGWHCKYAVDHGAKKVVGIDLSEKMIQEAKRKNMDPRIQYQVCGLEEYDYPKETYDCVISNLVLHYVPDLDSIYGKVYFTLKNNGVFLFNIEHPVYTAGVNQDWIFDSSGNPEYWPVDNYFFPGERTTNFLGREVTKQHHTLTQILMGLINIGFHLEAVIEAEPNIEMRKLPEMTNEMRRPMMLLVKATKR
jgi:SAM-dependent methyltransferase